MNAEPNAGIIHKNTVQSNTGLANFGSKLMAEKFVTALTEYKIATGAESLVSGNYIIGIRNEINSVAIR